MALSGLSGLSGLWGGFLPTDVPGLVLWLDASKIQLADGDPVSTWLDMSGNSKDAVQATGTKQPAYRASVAALGNKPAVQFGGDDGLMTPNINLSGTTAVTVYVVASGLTSGGDQVFIEMSTGLAVGCFLLFRATSNKLIGQVRNAVGTSNFTSTALFSGSDTAIISAIFDTSHPAATEARLDTDYAWFRLYNTTAGTGNETAFSTAGSSENTGNFGTFPMVIGSRNVASLFLNGYIAEVLVYSGGHSATDRYRVARYLGQKYNRRPQHGILICDGDSLTEGTINSTTFSTNPYPRQLDALLTRRYAMANFGFSGQTLAQMEADAVTQIDRLYSSASPINVISLWGGTNDMGTAGGANTAATTYSRLQTYCANRRAAGWKVVVSTCLPRSDTNAPADFETKRQAYNTSVRANWSTFADAIADVGNDATIGQAGQELNATYYLADRVHLTDAGYGIVAGIICTALATIGVF